MLESALAQILSQHEVTRALAWNGCAGSFLVDAAIPSLPQTQREGGHTLAARRRLTLLGQAFATLARDWVEPVLLPHLATHVCAPSRHGLCVIDLMTLLALVSTAVNQCFGRRTSDALSTLILEWIVASCGAAVDAHAEWAQQALPTATLAAALPRMSHMMEALLVPGTHGALAASKVLNAGEFLLPKRLLPTPDDAQPPDGSTELRFVVLCTSLDHPHVHHSAKLRVGTASQFQEVLGAGARRVFNTLSAMAASGVNLIVSTGALCDPAGQYCAELGMRAVQLAEDDDAMALCAAAGIEPVRSVDACGVLAPENIGRAREARPITLGREGGVLLSGIDGSRATHAHRVRQVSVWARGATEDDVTIDRPVAACPPACDAGTDGRALPTVLSCRAAEHSGRRIMPWDRSHAKKFTARCWCCVAN